MSAAAALDPARGRILGFARPPSGRPGTVEVLLGGRAVHRLVAGGPVAALLAVPALAAAAPDEQCSFALALPRRAVRGLEPGAVELALRLAGEPDPFFTHRFAGPAAVECYTEGARMAARFRAEIHGLSVGTLTGTLTGTGSGRASGPGEDAPAPPQLAAMLGGRRVAEVALAPDGTARWSFRAALPTSVLSDGIQHVEIAVAATGEVLARHPVAAGSVLGAELAAEVALLRAELDELRRAAFAAFAEPPLAASERALIVAELVGHVEALLGAQDARVVADLDRLAVRLGADPGTPSGQPGPRP